MLLVRKKIGCLALSLVSLSACPLCADIIPTAQKPPDTASQSAAAGGAAAPGSADNFLFTGSFLYHVSIDVPPGVAGMQPSLSLQYNSSNGNGLLGVGWDLSLGSIHRSTKNGVPRYTNADTFTMTFNGRTQELTYVGPDASGNSIYQAKIENAFLKFVQVGSQWEVWDKTGGKYYFGETSSSMVSGPSGPYLWALDKIVDRNGNALTISYTNDQSQLYPQDILYTSNDTSVPIQVANRKVHFTFETRPDPIISYRPGFNTVMAQRLSRIDTSITADGGATWTPIKTYTLSYSVPSLRVRSELTSVQVSGTDTNGTITLAVVRNDYFPTGNGFSGPASGVPLLPVPLVYIIPTSNGVQSMDMGVRFADIDGDGRVDILVGRRIDNASNQTSYVFQAYRNTRTGWQDVSSTWKPPVEFARQYFGNTNDYDSASETGARLVDVNGDGLPDFVIADTISGFGRKVWINNGSGWDATQGASWVLPNGLDLSANYSDQGFEFVDLNGDGLPDIVQGLQQNNSTFSLRAWINNGHGWDQNDAWAPPVPIVYAPALPMGTRFVDVNGDGLPDIIHCISDVSGVPPNQSANVIYLNTGAGWQLANWQAPRFLAVAGSGKARDRGVQFVDVNGDGLPDWVEQVVGEQTTIGIGGNDPQYTGIVYLNTGSGWVDASSNYAIPYPFVTVTGSDQFHTYSNGAVMLDMNGDGQPDFVLSNIHNGTITNSVWLSGVQPELLQAIHNPLGGEADAQYSCSLQLNGTHKIPFPIQVLTQLQNKDGRGGSITTTYTYDQGLYDPIQKEFLGFGKVTSSDSDGDKLVTYYHQNKDANGALVPVNALKGSSYRSETYGPSGNLITKQEAHWQYSQVYPGKDVYYVRSDSMRNTINDGPAPLTTEVDYTYDNYGNLTQSAFQGDISGPGDERTENLEYAQPSDPSSYAVGFPKRTFITDPGTGNVVSESRFLYDGTPGNPLPYGTVGRGNVTQLQRWLSPASPTSGSWLITKSEYNTLGQITSATDPKGYSTATSYDAFGYPTAVTNALLQTVHTVYDPGTGDVLSDTDLNNQTMTYRYDALGRRTKEIGPLDSDTYPSVQFNYHDDLLGNPHTQFVETDRRVQHGQPAILWSKTYFDGLGRTYQSETKDTGTNSVIVETTYNGRGLADKVSLPRFTSPSTSAQWTQSTYDALGRVTHVVHPDQTQTVTTYQGRQTFVQDADGNTQSSETDAYGRIVYRHEASISNATTYAYDVLGRLVRVIDSQAHNTSFGYDSLGRKLSMNDPNAGSWSYAYDDNGNLLKQTDARGVQLTFAYDALNRILSKAMTADPNAVTGQTVGVVLSSYTYDHVDSLRPYSKGRLTAVMDLSGQSDFFHDRLGEVVREVKTVGTLSYEFDRTYDALGRVTQLTYPNNPAVKYNYDDGGHLLSVTSSDGSVTYASYPSYDPQGQPLEMDQADNATQTLYSYDPLKSVLSSLQIKTSTTSLVNLSYGYDNVGNMLSITDNLNGARNQKFIYDALYRLTSATGIYGSRAYSYDSVGNFLTKDQATYTYEDVAHPSRVTETRPSTSPGLDGSTLLAWNLDPSESIYSISGSVNGAGQGVSTVSVVLSGLIDQAIATGLQGATDGQGQFQFRGLPGGVGADYSLVVSSVGMSASPAGYAFNVLIASQAHADFVLSASTSPTLDLSQVRIPRTSLAGGSPLPSESTGAFTAGLIGGLGYGGTVSTGGGFTQRSGYSPLPDPADTRQQPPAQYTPPPAAQAQGIAGPAFVPGRYAQALSFNGITDAFVFPGSQNDNPTAFTLMLWARPTNSYPSFGYATLLSKAMDVSASTGTITNGYRLVMDKNGKVIFEIGKSGGSLCLASSSSLPLNRWTFLAASYDGSQMKLYVNGQPDRTLSTTVPVLSNSLPISLAASLNSALQISTGTFYSGVLDEPRVEGRVWSAAEIGAVKQQYDNIATYTYDANGNRLSKTAGDTVWTYQYDAENRLSQVQQNGSPVDSFIYDGGGGRVKKISTSGTTLFVGKLYEERPDGSRIDHIQAGGQLICDLVTTGSTTQAFYYHGDHLGSVSLVTDPSGNKIEEVVYDPFGATSSDAGSSPNHRRYTGQEADDEIGLYDYGARFYDPLLGRFISPDTIVPSAMDPQSLNRYVYCRNNPIILTDPDGHHSFRNFLKSTIQVAEVAAIVAISIYDPGIALQAGIMIGATANAAEAALSGANGYGIADAGIQGAIAGGIGGAAGGAMGSHFTSPFIAAIGAGAVGGASAGAAAAVMMGADPRTAWRMTYQGAAIGAGSAAVFYGLTLTGNTPSTSATADDGPIPQLQDRRIIFDGSTIFWVDDEGDIVAAYDGISGNSHHRMLPEGPYSGTNLRLRPDNPGMYFGSDKSTGWSLNLQPEFKMVPKRTALEIHPDGGPKGTLGCIGVCGRTYAAELYGRIQAWFDTGANSIQVSVKYAW